MLITLRHL